MHTYLWGRQARGQGVVASDYRNVATAWRATDADADNVNIVEENAFATAAEDAPARVEPHVTWVIEDDVTRRGSSMMVSIINLSNTVVGAGIMGLPRVIAILGIIPGTLLITLVQALMIVTIEVLIRASEEAQTWSYAAVLKQSIGCWAEKALSWMVVLNNSGILLLYLVIMGDALVGRASPLPNPNTGSEGCPWFLSRWFLVGVITFVVLLPMVLQRHLSALAATSTLGLALAMLFALFTVVLVVLGALHGVLAPVSFWPSSAGGTQQVAAVFGVLPVVLLAMVIHYQVHPLDMDIYTEARMQTVVRSALRLCAGLYVVVATGLYLAFGDKVEGDVLLNFEPAALKPFVGSSAAFMCTVVRFGYALHLMMTFPLISWALREHVTKLLFGTTELSPQGWIGISLGILIVLYVAACAVTSSWSVMSVTGSTAAVMIAFIFPAFLIYVQSPTWPWRVGAICLAMIGLTTAAIAVTQTVSL